MAPATSSWARVVKNPKSWTLPYSLLVVGKGSRLIYSQHKTKRTAEEARTRLLRKHKTVTSARREMGWE